MKNPGWYLVLLGGVLIGFASGEFVQAIGTAGGVVLTSAGMVALLRG